MPHAALTPAAPTEPAPFLPPPPNATNARGNPNLALARAQPARGLDPRGAAPTPAAPAAPRQSTANLAASCVADAAPGRARPRACPGGGPGGRIRVRDARTIHGNYGAGARSLNRYRRTLLRISRVDIALDRYQAHLQLAFAARLCGYPPELMPRPRPTGGITAPEARGLRHAVATSLAPWRAATAEARAAARVAQAAAGGRSAGGTKPLIRNFPNLPYEPRASPSTPAKPQIRIFPNPNSAVQTAPY
jgi:hypothetical protein